MTHSVISGHERNNNVEELTHIKDKNQYNSLLIEKAFYNLDFKLLESLKGWSKKAINNAKKRLADVDFKWTKGLESLIPIDSSERYLTEQKKKEFLNAVLSEIKIAIKENAV